MDKVRLAGVIGFVIGILLIIQKLVFYGAVYTPRYFLDVFDHGLYGIVLVVVGLALLIARKG